ncbi:MAG TPA: VWA domain-containing protein [Thermoanaerobaculia bacterium]|nr:VWA domain-containing protein [Thermoanaerobaculia bacterium]
MLRRILVPVVLLLLTAVSLLAQNRLPQASEMIEVSIVNVDVIVTDKQGNRVRGLTKDDFEIREQGRVQPITNFAEYSPLAGESVSVDGVAPATAPAAATAAPRAKRTIVVFIEWFKLPGFRTKPMFAAMRKLLRETVRPGDAVSIVTWANAPKVRLELTDDIDAIERVLTEIEKDTSGIDVYGSEVAFTRQESAMAQAWQNSVASAASARGLPTMEMGAIGGSGYARAKLELYRIKQKAAALNALMQSMSGIEGKKIVLMATHRFGNYAGFEFVGGGFLPPSSEFDTREIRESVIRTANANNITLYPIYPTGLGWTTEDASVTRENVFAMNHEADYRRAASDHNILMNETGSLDQLADETGGAMAAGHANIVDLLPRIGEDLESYYSLAYRTTAERKDRVKDLEVRTKNRDYVVRARQQYVEKSDATKMADRVTAGLFRTPDGSVIPLQAEIGKATKTGSRRWVVPLKIRVPIDSLTTIEQRNAVKGSFSVFIASGAEFGVISDVVQRTQPFTIETKDLARAKGSHFTYEFELKIDDITDRVSIGVLDEVSKEYGLKVLTLPNRDVLTADMR